MYFRAAICFAVSRKLFADEEAIETQIGFGHLPEETCRKLFADEEAIETFDKDKAEVVGVKGPEAIR